MSMVRVVFAIGAAACAALLPAWTAQGSGPAPRVQSAGPPSALSAPAGRLYFPPADGPWETVDPAAAGWNAAGLEAALALAGGRGFDRRGHPPPRPDPRRTALDPGRTVPRPRQRQPRSERRRSCRRGRRVRAEERGRRPGRSRAGARPAGARRSGHRSRRPLDAGDGSAGTGGDDPAPDGDDHRPDAGAGVRRPRPARGGCTTRRPITTCSASSRRRPASTATR